jgi:hypothetical protein
MMHKNIIAVTVIIIVLLVAGFSFVTARYIDKEEILRATVERETLQKQRIELMNIVAKADSEKVIYQQRVTVLEGEAVVLRAKVDSLETKRKTVQLAMRELRTTSDLEKQFMDAFPEVKMSMKITSIPVEDAPGLTVQYISVPLRFAETFLIDHQNSSYYKQQRDKLWQLDTLQQQTIALHRKITRLEEEKSAAYKQGYDSVHLNQEFEPFLLLLHRQT